MFSVVVNPLILLSPVFDVPYIVSVVGLFLLTGYFVVKTYKLRIPQSFLTIIKFAFPLISLNVIFSINPIESLIHWVLVILIYVAYSKSIDRLTRDEIMSLFKLLPWMIFTSAVIIYLGIKLVVIGSISTYNSIGMISGGSLVLSRCSTSKYRDLISLLSFLILLDSHSRGSIIIATFCFVILFIRQELTYRRFFSLRVVFLVTLFVFFGTGVVSHFTDSLAFKSSEKELMDVGLIGSLKDSNEDRLVLIDHGIDLARRRPILGWGLNSNYSSYMVMDELNMGLQGLHVHNGYLSMFIEVGILLSLFFMVYIIKLLLLLTHPVQKELKLLKQSVALFILYGLLRGYGEDYLFLNMGNIFSQYLIFFSALFFSRKFEPY
jgi:O-antigen ligase